MIQLIATFEVDLPGQFLAAWPEGEKINSDCNIGGFEVAVELVRDSSLRVKGRDDENWTYALNKVVVKVDKQEPIGPPPVKPDEKGQLDYTIQSDYFDERIEEYGAVAREAVNRLIRFFKYRLKTPYLQEFPEGDHSFKNAEWTDSTGAVVCKGPFFDLAKGIPGLRGQLSVQKFRPELAASLRAAIQEPPNPQLHEELISNAQTALFDHNLRRAVIELAIACEIVVKRTFFASDSPAGAAFDYLEDKSQVKVTVLDLMDRVAQEAFGRSFKKDHRVHYQNIDFMFRCRNKIAHRGDLSFRDDAGIKTNVNYEIVVTWWESVQYLMAWLSEAL